MPNNQETPEVTLCCKCQSGDTHNIAGNMSGTCTSQHAPYSDFVNGLKDCYALNKRGVCKHYLQKGTS